MFPRLGQAQSACRRRGLTSEYEVSYNGRRVDGADTLQVNVHRFLSAAGLGKRLDRANSSTSIDW